MPLKLTCPDCGREVFVATIDDERKGFRLYYDCAKCNKVNAEDYVPKRTW